MEHIKNLRSVYSFPGCDARATVQSYRDDPAAIVVSLQRRRKKRSVLAVGPPIDRIMTLGRVTCVTSRVGTGVFSCSFSSDE
jgi:hypothetical protein